MSHALIHPEYGYYSTRDPFGTTGDFTTAPEISQMFGEMLAAWLIDLWQQMDKTPLDIIEFGPGRGTLMADILRIACKVDDFTKTVKIHLIESSPLLREKQKLTLKKHTETINITWHEGLPQSKTPAILIGNEFLDALPIEQLMRDSKGWQKRVIINGPKGFEFAWQAAPKDLLSYLPQKTTSNSIYEIAPDRIKFINQCAEHLIANNGAALFIDYGHKKSHHGETLQAVKNHKYVNSIKDIGNADLTAHVDFDALIRTVCSRNVSRETLVTQRQFLLNLGIEHRAAALSKQKDVTKDLMRLIAPDQMGELFKVMCFHAGSGLKPAGFV